MPKRPLAHRQLARMNDMLETASICRTVEERELSDNALLLRGANEDRAFAEEVRSLARSRGWELPKPEGYAWQLMAEEGDHLPRVVRILNRDAFELDGIARDTDDDDVSSLAQQLRNQRRHLIDDLARQLPQVTLPGAK